MTLRFPEMKGRALNRRTMRLPHDLPTDCIVLMVFRQRQQREADAWKATLAPMTDLPVFEVTYIRSLLRPLARYAEWGMRHGIVADSDRAHTIVVFGIQRRLARQLDGDPDRPIVVRVHNGVVAGRAQGRPDPAAARMLLSAAS